MKMQDARDRMQDFGLMVILVFLLVTCHLSLVTASEKWQGVDEAVVEKIAREHGREANKPLINTDHGDILLFAFLIAGAAGGFAAGYYWKTLIDGKTSKPGAGKDKN